MSPTKNFDQFLSVVVAVDSYCTIDHRDYATGIGYSNYFSDDGYAVHTGNHSYVEIEMAATHISYVS